MDPGQSPDDERPEGRFISQGYQGAVFVIGSGASRTVVKRPMGGRIARRIRRAMLRHEYRIYQRLAGVEGVPRCRGLRNDGSLELEYVAGEAFHEGAPALRDREAFFDDLLAIILSLHAAGVAHGDLKRRGNILVTPDGKPCLIDFGSAVARPDSHGVVRRLLFDQFRRMDLNAWIKLKYRRRYAAVTSRDAPYYQPTALEAVARAVRRVWRPLTGRKWRKARRRRGS